MTLPLNSLFAAQSGTALALTLLVALFPVISLSVPSGCSTLYTLLALIALFRCWPEWRNIGREEKSLLAGLGLFFLVAALSLVQTTDMANGLERLERIFRLTSLGLLFLLFRRFRVDAGAPFMFGLLLATLSLAVQTGYEYFYLGKGLVQGIYYKIAFGDLAMLIAALFLAAAMTLGKRGVWLGLLLMGSLVAFVASLLSEARGAWLFLPFLLVLLAWLYRAQISRRLIVGCAVAMLAGVLLLVVARPAFLFAPVAAAISNIQQFIDDPQPYSSVGARLNLWYNSLQIWWQHPWFGTGLGDFEHDNRALVAAGLSMSTAVERYGHAHSIFFDALATMGGVGLLAMVTALFILPFRYLHRQWSRGAGREARFHALAGMFTVVAFAAFGLSEGWLSRNPLVNPYTVYLSLLLAGASLHGSQTKPAGS